MEHHFTCSYHCSCGSHISWDASWELVGGSEELDEILIHVRNASYLIILGCSAFCGVDFLCIPRLHVGLEIDSLKDPHRTEYLLSEYGHLDRRTCVTIAQALCQLGTVHR